MHNSRKRFRKSCFQARLIYLNKNGRRASRFLIIMKKRSIIYLLIICLISGSISLASCGKKTEKFTKYSFDYFDTASTVIGYAESEEVFNAVCEDIFAQLENYHRLFTIYHRYEGLENLCTVNELCDGAHRTVKVDRDIIDLLLYCKEVYKKTDGKVNIAMGSVLSIWHDYRTEGMDEPWNAKLPSRKELELAAEHTDINDLVIDEENCTVTITDPEMKLDVGAVAKGYAVELIARDLADKGITGYVLNIGGNVRTVGFKGDGEKWTVGVENPDTDDEDNPYVAHVKLAGESLVTSGSYQRYYTVDGKNYHHIIDSETLMPSELFQSVSIICESSADGDMLSTALFCMDLKSGLELIESLDGTEAMWIDLDGEKHYSEGFRNYTEE